MSSRSLKLLVSALGSLLFFAQHVSAEIIRYTDDAGQVHYVDSVEKVPGQFREQLHSAKPLPSISRSKSVDYAPVDVGSPLGSRKSKEVEIYVTDWCGYCRRLEDYLKRKQIRYTRYDIEKDEAANRRFKQFGGRGFPLTKIGSSVVKGYNPDAIEEALMRR